MQLVHMQFVIHNLYSSSIEIEFFIYERKEFINNLID